ncbi:MAG: dynein regulation protein LC7 [Aquificae bacterium]|nr:dynein regulation protein LC7 [Aquificota bacterium]
MNILKKQEEIRNFFKEIVRENKLDGIILTDMEGLPMVSFLDEEMDEDTLSASGAAIVSASLITANDAKKEEVREIIIDTKNGYLVFVPVKGEYILGVFTPKDTKLGILRVIIKEVEKFLDSL